MGWGAWVFNSAVWAERESVPIRYVVSWLFGHDAISSKQRKIASSSTVKTAARVAVTVCVCTVSDREC